MDNRFQIVGYVLTVAGLWIAASLWSPSSIPYGTWAWMTLGVMGLGLVLSAMGSGLWPAPVVAQLLVDHDTPAGPRNGA